MKALLFLFSLLVAAPALAKDAVAVLYFDYEGADPELSALKVGLAQMMTTDLTGQDAYDVVEREKLQAILDELKLGRDGLTEPGTAAKIGKLLGVRYLVVGSYFPMMGTLTVHSHVIEVETGVIYGALDIQGPLLDFMKLEKQAADHIRGALAGLVAGKPPPVPGSLAPVPVAPAPAAPAPPSAAPKTRDGSASAETPEIEAPDEVALEAAVAFSDGLIFLDAGDKAGARESFQKALATSEGFDDAKAALAKLDI